MRRGQPSTRRGFVIIMVLVVVGCAILVATGLLFSLQADAAGTTTVVQSTRSRAIAWSGVQAVMRRLHQQRDVILDGLTPELDSSFELYEANGRLGVVRLLPFPDGRMLVPEGGRLDVNHASPEALERTGMIDSVVAQAIVDARTSRGRFQSLAELLDVEGITPEMLYGPLEDIRPMDDAMGDAWYAPEPTGDELAVGLAEVLTVYGFEPLLQRSGRKRINLNVPWSDELGERVDERFGEGTGQVVQQLMTNGTVFDSELALFNILAHFEVEPNDWIEACDALSMSDQPIVGGRLDINSASYEALTALPGIEPEIASEIIRRRDELPLDLRASVAWPVIEEIIDPLLYTEMGNLITTRSWCYRVRLGAGEVSVDDPDGPLEDPMIIEAVIDLADPSPRVAYLREVTLLQTATSLTVAALDAWIEEDLDDRELADEADLMTMDDLMMEPLDPSDDGTGDPWPPLGSEEGVMPDPFDDPMSDADNMGDPGGSEGVIDDDDDTPSTPDDPNPTDPRVGRWRSGG